jgi:hypothetical protein
MDTKSFINALDMNDLATEASALVAWDIGIAKSVDDVAQYMYRGGPWPPQAALKHRLKIHRSEDDHRPERKYWEYVKTEMAIFLCEDDKRYRELWRRLGSLEKKGTPTFLTVIAAYLGEKAGVQTALLVSFVAVCLYGAAKLGKEAFCRYLKDRDA